MDEEGKTLEEMEEEEERGYFTRQDFRLVKYLLEEKGIPEEWINRFWIAISKSTMLTNLTEIDVKRFMMEWDDLVRIFLMSIPHYKYTYEIEMVLNQLRQIYHANLKRSTGGTQRERFILGAQIQQRIGEGEERPRGGIISSLQRIFHLKR